MSKAKTILVPIADTHCGGSTAIAPPTFTIHNQITNEEQIVHHNRLQSWIWENWTSHWDYVKFLAGWTSKRKRKHRIIFVHVGDVIDGNHHGTLQIVQDVADQVLMAMQIFEPIVDMCDAFYGVLGTNVHGSNEEAAIYRNLGANDYGQNIMLEVDGKLHDFAHHGRTGSRPWTSGAVSIGVEVMLDCGQQGLPYPDYVWRGHKHNIDDSGDRLDGTRVICLPSWQLKTEFGHRVVPNRTRSDIGGYIVDGGLVDNSRARYKGQPDQRKVIKFP